MLSRGSGPRAAAGRRDRVALVGAFLGVFFAAAIYERGPRLSTGGVWAGSRTHILSLTSRFPCRARRAYFPPPLAGLGRVGAC